MKLTAKYDNPYEAAYNLLKNNQWFNQTDWDVHARRGELDQYVSVLSETDKLPSFHKMQSEYRMDLMDTDRRFLAMANELNADRTNVDVDRFETYYDETTGTEKERNIGKMSDYDYNKYLLKQYAALREQQEAFEREVQRKDDMNGFVKFLSTVFVSVPGELVTGIMDWTDDVINLVEAISDSIDAGFRGNDMGDAFRNAYTKPDWRLFDNIGWIDAIREWESKYSFMRNVDGSYTGVGQFLGGVSYSLGEAIPSMAINLIGVGAGSAAKAGKISADAAIKVANNAAKAATALYYTGLGSGHAREMFNDPRMATVPTYKIVLNASIKTVAEYAMQKLTSKAFGSTTLDHLIFGEQMTKIAGKTLGRQFIKRAIHDFIAEGTEELLQEYSSWIVDRFFALDEQRFADMTDWDMKTLINAFILGGLSTIGTNVMGAIMHQGYDFLHDAFVKDKNVTFNRIDIDTITDTNMREQVQAYFDEHVDEDSATFTIPAERRVVRLGGKIINPFSAREFKITLSDMMEQFNAIQNDKSLSVEQMQNAAGQMYVSMRTIAAFYKEIGQEAFQKATNLLEEIKAFDAKVDTNADVIRQHTQAMLDTLSEMNALYAEDRLRKKIEKKLGKKKITTLDHVITRDGVLEITDPQLKDTLQRMFDANPDLDQIALTEDGTAPVFDEETRSAFIPLDYAKATSAEGMLKNQAEQALVENTVNARVYKSTLNMVADIYRDISGRSSADIEEVVYNLFFNDVFQDILLHQANRAIFELIAHLDTIEEIATRKAAKDAVYKERIKNVRSQLAVKLAQYLVYQQVVTEAQIKQLKIFDKKQIAYIAQQRWSRDLANRLIAGETLSDADKRMLTERVNYSPMDADMKARVLENLFSDNEVSRRSALSVLERYYENQFNSPYDGRTYLLDNTQSNIMFNEYLQLSGLTIKTLFKVDKNSDLYKQIEADHDVVNRQTILAYHRNQFKAFTNAKYDFTVVNGQIQIHELTAEQQRGFNGQTRSKIYAHNNNIDERTFITPTTEQRSLLAKVLSRDLDAVSRAVISLRDIIFDPENLTKKVRAEINEQYKKDGGLTPNNTFLYLRQRTLDESGGVISIVQTIDGNFAFVNISQMVNALIDPDMKTQTKNETNINAYIKGEYLQGRLANVVVRLSDKFQYLPTSNVIEVDRNATNAEFRFGLMHEFQHAIQVENGLNGGLDAQWLTKLNAKQRRTIINDIREHKPELFKDVKKGSAEEIVIASEFIYLTTGESQAYGTEGMSFIDYYPTVVRTVRGQTTITTLWGAQYDITNNNMTLSVSNTFYNDQLRVITKIAKTLTQPSNADYRHHVLLPDGSFRVIDYDTHLEYFTDVEEKALAQGLSQNDINKYEYVTITLRDMREFGAIDEDAIVITVGDEMTNDQRRALIDVIDKAIIDGRKVILGDERLNVSTDEDVVSGDELLKTYIRKSNQLGMSMNQTMDANQRKINEYAQQTYHSDMKPNSLTGFIFPDGTVGFSETMWTHEQFYDDLAQKFTTGVEQYHDSLVEIALNGRFGHQYIDNISIRINGNLNVDQKASLLDLVNDLLAADVSLEIEHIPTGRYVNSTPGDFNGRRLLAGLGRVWNGGSSMDMAQPGRSRRVRVDVHESTNLKYFPKRKLLSPDLQDFVVNTSRIGLEPAIWEKIGGGEKGTLTKTWLMNWFRDADSINDYTFKKIKQYFFPDQKWIKTFDDLKFVEDNLRNYYAMRVVLKSIGREDILYKITSKKAFSSYLEQINSRSDTRRLFEKIWSRYDNFITERGERADGSPRKIRADLIIHEADHRRAIMKTFDGTINKGAYFGVVSKAVAMMLFEKPYYKGGHNDVQIDAPIRGDSNLTYSDVLSDTDIQEMFNERVAENTRKQMVDMLVDYSVDRAEEQGIKLSQKETDALRKAIDHKSDDVIEAMFTKAGLALDFGLDYELGVDPNATVKQQVQFDKEILKTSIIKKSTNYQTSIRQFGNTITNNVAPKAFKKLPKDVQEMFENGKLKPEVYQGKSRDELLATQALLREIAQKAKNGEFDIKDDATLRREINKLKRELKKAYALGADAMARAARIDVKEVKLGDYQFNFQTNLEMPIALREMLDTSFTQLHDTKVKFLTPDGEQHLRMNYKTFMDQNAVKFTELTQGDVDAIVDYFTNSSLQVNQMNEQSAIQYETFKMFILSTMIELSRQGIVDFILNSEQVTRAEKAIKNQASIAATVLSTFKTMLPKLNPAKILVQSMAKANGIEFDEALVNDMVTAISAQDIARAQIIREQMYTDVLEKAKTYKIRRGILDKILAFERMAMLSSPGTWMRNFSSNIMLTASNVIGDVIGAALNKIGSKFKNSKAYSVEQYRLTGTKIDQKTYDFVKSKIIDSGLLELIRDGVSKYDTTRSGNTDTASRLTKAIMRSVENQVFSTAFDDRVMGTVSKVMQIVLSDNVFIDKRVKAYIGKMLIEDNINIDNGITAEVEDVIVNAYTLAAYEYMHKPNFLSRMEQSLRTNHPAAYFAYKQIFPFASASWNWFVEGLSYTPIGLAKGIIELARIEKKITKLEDRRQKGENTISPRFTKFLALRDIGKGVIGSVTMGIGMLLAAFGVAGVDKEDDKVKLRVTIGGEDVYIDISSLTGTQGVMLGITLMNPRKGNVMDVFYDVADTLLNDSIINSLYDTFRYSNSVGEFTYDEAFNILNMFVPNALKAFNSFLQPNKVQYSSGILGQLERFATNLIPGLTYAFPTRVDPYTGETQSKYRVPFIMDFWNRMTPIKVYNYNVSDMEKTAIALGLRKGELTGNYTDIGKLDSKNRSTLNRKYGELNKKSLAELTSNRVKYTVEDDKGKQKTLTWSQMTDKQRATVINRIMTQNAKYAKIYVYTTEMGGKYYASASEYNALRQLGIIRNIYHSAAGKDGFAA